MNSRALHIAIEIVKNLCFQTVQFEHRIIGIQN